MKISVGSDIAKIDSLSANVDSDSAKDDSDVIAMKVDSDELQFFDSAKVDSDVIAMKVDNDESQFFESLNAHMNMEGDFRSSVSHR